MGTKAKRIFPILVPLALLAVACQRDTAGPEPGSMFSAAKGQFDPVPEYAYVGYTGAPFVSVIDVQGMNVVATIDVPNSSAPNLAIAPNGQLAYVVHRGAPQPGDPPNPGLSKVDLSTGDVIGTAWVTPGTRPVDVALTSNGHRAFVTQFYGKSVAAINTRTMTLLAEIPLSDEDDYVNGIAMGPGSRHVFVSSQESGRIHVIDTDKLEVVETIEPGVGDINELALTQDGRHILGTGSESWVVVVVDAQRLTIEGTISTAGQPVSIDIPANGREAYVADDWEVTVIDTKALEVIANISLPAFGRRIAVSTNGRLAMVTHQGTAQATLVDLPGRAALSTVDLADEGPWGVAFANGPARN
jgi:DNA-binding beta-propeller fold protein YncE